MKQFFISKSVFIDLFNWLIDWLNVIKIKEYIKKYFKIAMLKSFILSFFINKSRKKNNPHNPHLKIFHLVTPHVNKYHYNNFYKGRKLTPSPNNFFG